MNRRMYIIFVHSSYLGLLSRTQNPHFKKTQREKTPFEVSKTLPSAGSYGPGKVVQMQSNFSLAMARQRPHLLGLGSTQLCFVWSQMKPIQNGDAPKIHALPVDYILVPAFEMIKRCFPMNLSRNTAPHHTTHAYSMCWYDISWRSTSTPATQRNGIMCSP